MDLADWGRGRCRLVKEWVLGRMRQRGVADLGGGHGRSEDGEAENMAVQAGRRGERLKNGN
jgi:hypothetical protein